MSDFVISNSVSFFWTTSALWFIMLFYGILANSVKDGENSIVPSIAFTIVYGCCAHHTDDLSSLQTWLYCGLTTMTIVGPIILVAVNYDDLKKDFYNPMSEHVKQHPEYVYALPILACLFLFLM